MMTRMERDLSYTIFDFSPGVVLQFRMLTIKLLKIDAAALVTPSRPGHPGSFYDHLRVLSANSSRTGTQCFAKITSASYAMANSRALAALATSTFRSVYAFS